jgi:hypothetical protein
MPFLDSLDIARRSCQHLGIARIETIDEDSKANQELANAYDKLREAELRRNLWQFSIKLACLRPMTRTTLLLQPPLWDSGITYLPGAVVRDVNNDFWSSSMVENRDNEPGQSLAWDQYFGPITADAYDSSQTYMAGELVYIINGQNDYSVYLSLENGNADSPQTADFWDATTVYGGGQVVSFSVPPATPIMYRSLIELNQNIQPTDAPQLWELGGTYIVGTVVTGSDFSQYTATSNDAGDFDPVGDDGDHWLPLGLVSAWSASPSISTVATSWLQIPTAKLVNMRFTYPIGTGPMEQSVSRNVYRLPANYMRTAPQDPTAGANPALGAPSGLQSTDWEYQDGYIVTRMTSPIILRFGADVTMVPKFDAMFCEGLAARMAFETCEALTQSTGKKQQCMVDYNKSMSEARIVNAIEEGPVEPPLDDWITCRI